MGVRTGIVGCGQAAVDLLPALKRKVLRLLINNYHIPVIQELDTADLVSVSNIDEAAMRVLRAELNIINSGN